MSVRRPKNAEPVKVIDPEHDLEFLDEMCSQKRRAHIIASAHLERTRMRAAEEIADAEAAAALALEELNAAVDEMENELKQRGSLCRK